jgi:predicted amidohydrolase
MLRTLASENHIAILGSFQQQSNPFPKNTSIVIASDGQIFEKYAKMHLFSPSGEEERFLPGNALGIFPLGTLTCGIAICYDLRFPDLFRIYASRGVQAVFVPAAWPSMRIRQWEIFITARAAENQIYVVGVNMTGTTPVGTYNGHSMTTDPHGTIIQRASEEEQLLFADLDPAILEKARCSLPIEKDRQDDVDRSLRNPEPV